MAEYSKQIHYRLNNTVNDIKLYTSTEDVGSDYVSVMDSGATVYAALVDPSDSYASDVKIRKDGNTFAFAREANLEVEFDPNPNLLLARTRAGTHTRYYKIGDAFDIELNGVFTDYVTFDHLACKAFIIGFDHNKDLETGGANSTHLAIGVNTDDVQIAFYGMQAGGVASLSSSQTTTGVYPSHICGSQKYTTGGWSQSDIRTKIMPNFFNALPSDWQAIIGDVTKYTDNDGNHGTKNPAQTSDVTATTDKLFIPSEYEVFGECKYSNAGEKLKQQRYEWFSSISTGGSMPIGKTEVRYQHDLITQPAIWWLRSVVNNSGNQCCAVEGATSASTSVPVKTSYHTISFGSCPLDILPCFAVF